MANQESGNARRRALIRLVRLYQLKALTALETTELARALWRSVDPTGLPTDTNLHPWALLQLPEPEPGYAANQLREYCLRTPLAALCRRTVTPDGKEVLTAPFPTESRDPLYLIRMSTKDSAPTGIEWSEAEAETLWDKIAAWWDEEGKGLSRSEHPILVAACRDRCDEALNVIAVAIAPRIDPNSRAVSAIVDFSQEVQERSIPIDTIVPALASWDPDRSASYAASLRQSIVSMVPARVESAIRAVGLWSSKKYDPRLPDPPPDLMGEVGAIVAARRQPGLLVAIVVAAEVLRLKPSARRPELLERLCNGLDYLVEETRYRSPGEAVHSHLPYDQLPEYRAAAVRLAGTLSTTELVSAKCVQAWLQIAATDPLPEVRRALKDS